ncbi:MAG: hypothetical protein GY711_24525 [bacterium]|nr:hypothetical protein [bacterium]
MTLARTTCSLTLAILAPLAAGQDRAVEASAPAKAPDDVAVAKAIETAVALLVANQENYEKDRGAGRIKPEQVPDWQVKERERLAGLRGGGSEWPYEGVYRVQRGIIPSGYRVGGTAIVCETLLEVPGFGEDEARRSALVRGVTFILDTLENDEQMAVGPKRGYDVRGWGHTYALHLLLRCLERGVLDEKLAAASTKMIPHLLACIEKNQTEQGGWNYASDKKISPFMTASTLLALYRAKAHGHEVPAAMVDKALEALQQGRSDESGAYAYSGRGEEVMPSSSARAAAAELALFRAGKSDVDALRRAVAGFFDGWEELLKRKSKTGTHKAPYGIAPYYFFFGHTYAALAIEYLPEGERQRWRDRMVEVLWRTREEHGGWNDRIFPRTESYSTAMVLQALIAPRLPAVPEWK